MEHARHLGHHENTKPMNHGYGKKAKIYKLKL
jgi:hypothetical protein